MRINHKTFILLVVLAFAIFQSLQNPQSLPNQIVSASPTPKTIENILCTVTKVIDGDTFEITGGQKVRMIGMDTPEITNNTKCFGIEAKVKAEELLKGKQVRMEKDISETDIYGRLLRYVYINDVLINELLVKEGYASVATYPPDVKYQELLQKAQQEARMSKKGLWSACSR